MISHPRRVAAAVGSALAVAGVVVLTVSDANAAVAPVKFANQQVYFPGAIGGPGPHETSTAAGDLTSDGAADIVMTETFNPAATGPLLRIWPTFRDQNGSGPLSVIKTAPCADSGQAVGGQAEDRVDHDVDLLLLA